ncbi:MAG: GNAT family N-acetyltransferase [Melioribacteraceae bacterium]|nr:GNAT family N-acetyltransferase [Ignavibacteriaceae bacterium]MBX3009733.1 GNAT family N-acetyltransferase [Melioribacteraceae bacterium]
MIREYHETDLKYVIEVWHSSVLIAHNFLTEEFIRIEQNNLIDVYIPNTKTFVYLYDNIVVGFISLIGNEVGGLFVSPLYQRKNIGKLLIEYSEKLVGKLEVEVFDKNIIGKSFYYKNNFLLIKESIHKETSEKVLRLRQK